MKIKSFYFNRKFHLLFILTTLLLFPQCITHTFAQSEDLATDKIKKEFPLLTARYGNQFVGQKAHYIFAVDVSSSMSRYQEIVIENLQKFVDALPDGDQITVIRMADENYTDYVNMFKCITLDSRVRQSFYSSINGGGFQFLEDGDPRNGSDGFTTARLILDAINTVGSNELTFIYLLTDFEYWTHANHYDKNKEDWKSLLNKVPESYRNGMCKFGIELDSGIELHNEAIFKNEMDGIFGPITYQPVSSAAVLSQWFGHLIASTMASKLNVSLKKEWKDLFDSIKVESYIEGGRMIAKAKLKGKNSNPPLVDSLSISLASSEQMINPVKGGKVGFGDEICIGQVDIKKRFFPGYVSIGGDSAKLNVRFYSKYEDEISKLQNVCHESPEDTGVGLWERNYSLDSEAAKAWGSFIPLWAWLLIGFVLLVILASFIYQYLVLKTNHKWLVRVQEKGRNFPSPQPDFMAPFSIGNQGEFKINGCTWSISINGKRYNPLLFWKKSGYYISGSGGTFTVKDTSNTSVAGVAPGTDAYLCPLSGGNIFIISNLNIRIDLQN